MLSNEDLIAAMVFGFGLSCMLWVPAYMFSRAQDVINTIGTSD